MTRLLRTSHRDLEKKPTRSSGFLKTGVDDPSHILAGGTFQVLDEEGNVVLEISDEGEDGFGIGYDWKQWTGVLKADETYYLHEVTPPDGYTQAKEDVKFTVGHYGEKVEAIVTNERIPGLPVYEGRLRRG